MSMIAQRGAYWKYWKAGVSCESWRYEVYLDGIPVPLAIEADAERGLIRCYAANAAGEIDHDCFARPKIRQLHGRVEIRSINDRPI